MQFFLSCMYYCIALLEGAHIQSRVAVAFKQPIGGRAKGDRLHSQETISFLAHFVDVTLPFGS